MKTRNNPTKLDARLTTLLAEGLQHKEIAKKLVAEGFKTPKNFTPDQRWVGSRAAYLRARDKNIARPAARGAKGTETTSAPETVAPPTLTARDIGRYMAVGLEQYPCAVEIINFIRPGSDSAYLGFETENRKYRITIEPIKAKA